MSLIERELLLIWDQSAEYYIFLLVGRSDW